MVNVDVNHPNAILPVNLRALPEPPRASSRLARLRRAVAAEGGGGL